jgi:hypothetical protein
MGLGYSARAMNRCPGRVHRPVRFALDCRDHTALPRAAGPCHDRTRTLSAEIILFDYPNDLAAVAISEVLRGRRNLKRQGGRQFAGTEDGFRRGLKVADSQIAVLLLSVMHSPILAS